MIISHQHKFIFLKTNKTAGTSIEIALSRFCGKDDIITPIKREDEAIRQAKGYPGPQHYLAPLSEYGLRDFGHLLLRLKRKCRFYNHITAREAKAAIGDQVWNAYYKFCFERNPFDRVVSHYYWQCRAEPQRSVSSFVRSPDLLTLKSRGQDLYTIDGMIAVDRVCRFENLVEELESVRLHLGLPEPLDLPRAKGKHRPDKRSYREILSEEDRKIIAEQFREEIERFGYTF